MNDDSMVKIMQSLGLNYKPAVDSTEQFKESVKSLNKDMAYFKSNAIETAKSINKAFTAEFGNIKAQDIKKIFDQIDKYNKPVEIKVVTDKAEIVMEKFSKDMGIKLDKNLRNELQKMVSSFATGIDTKEFEHLAERINVAFAQAMEKKRRKLTNMQLEQTDEAKVYKYLQNTGKSGGIKLDYASNQVKNEINGFSESMRGLVGINKEGKTSLEDLQSEMTGMGLVAKSNITTYNEFSKYLMDTVNKYRELKAEGIDMPLDNPLEREKYVKEELTELIAELSVVQAESKKAKAELSKVVQPDSSLKEQSETIQEVIRQYKAGIMEAKEFIRIADELKVNKDQWGSLPVQAKQDQISLQNSLTKATREYSKSLKELEQYKDALTETGDYSKQQAQITNQMNELIRLRKTLQIESKEFMERASKIGPGTKGWDMLNSKDQVKLVNEITKAEKEHKRALLDNEKIVSKTNLEKMKAQAASIQQRATTKKLGNEYVKQSSALRKQVEELQSKLQIEGKLSAEEVKQTQQLQEQLNILKAQTASAVSDQVRENPNFLGEEFQRRTSWFLTGTMFYGIVNGAKQATEAIKDVEMGMIEIARVMDDSSFIFEEYRDNLFNLGIEYGQTFDNVQQIALRWAQSGYNVKDSLELAETSLLALNTAELDAQNATEAMIGIMAQWQLEAEDMALVMDKINITADNYSVTSQDLVDGLLRSSGAARVMNLSMEDTIGLLTVMREASGRTGAEVGNALNSILSYIQRPKSIDLLESLGISMFADEAKTQFRGVLDIFKDIASNWNTLSTEIQDGFVASADDAELFNEELAGALGMQEEWNDLQQRDISQASAGVYRRNYFIGMIERLSNVQGVLNNMMDAEGYSMRENEKAMEALDKKQQSLKASLEALAVAAGDAGLGGSLKTLANGGTWALNAINKMPKPMKDLTMAATSTFLAVKALELGMKTFGIKLPGVSEMIKELTDGTWSLTKVFKAGKEGIGTFLSANGPLLAISASIGVIVAVTNHMKKEREEKEKAIQVSKENIQSLEEEKQGLTELASEYETLKTKEKNLTTTADEKERLLEIQRELVDTYEVSISGIDAEGKAYANSTTAIQDRIKALEEEKALETEKLESAVMAKDSEDVAELEKNLAKRKQIAEDLKDIQKQIDEYSNTIQNKGTLNVSSQYGSGTIDASTEHGANILKGYIANASSQKVALQTALDDINVAIEEGTSDRERLLKEDATKTIQALSENGVEISDEARAFATEMASALSQAPKDIFTVRDDLEEAIKEFNSIKFDGSTFTEWAEKYNKAIANGDNKGIDEAANAINGLVREVSQGKPEMDNFVIAMEGIYPTTAQIASAAENAEKQTLDFAGAMGRMGVTAKKAMDDLKVLNQAIYDVKHGQSLSIDTILELIEKYDLSTDAIKKTTDGYTIEVSALEKLRGTKIQTAIDGIEAEKRTAQNTIDAVKQRLESYGLEIEMLGNLAEARAALAGMATGSNAQVRSRVSEATAEDMGLEAAMREAEKEFLRETNYDLIQYNKAVNNLDKLNKRAELLKGMLGNSDYGVTKTKDKKGKKAKKDEPNFIDPIDAEIRAIQSKNDNLEKSNELLREQLDLAKNIEGIEGLNKQYEINGKLIENNKKLLKSYKDEQTSLHNKANNLRNKNKKYNIDSWFDANAEQTQAYVNQYDKLSKKEQENMDKVFIQMQKYKKAWMDSNKEAKNVVNTTRELERETASLVIQQEDMARNKLHEVIEAQKRNAYLDLERRQRRANERLETARQEMEDDVEYYQNRIDRIQDEIDRIQESERARQESLERSKRLEEISKLQNRYYALQYQNLSDLTEEQAESLGLEREREASLKRREDIEKEQIKRQEYQNELLELRNKLENIRNQKTKRQYKELEDGTWDFVHVADQDAIDNVEKQIKDTEEKIEDSNKQIEDLEKEHDKTLKDLKKQTLKDLKQKQEDYDEWERQNRIQRQIERKQQRIKEYQDEIQDLQDRYAEKERLTNEAFAAEKENLDRYYTDIDLLTDEKMKELYETFNGNWTEIHGMLSEYFDDIRREYRSLVGELSQPISLPDISGGGGGGGGGRYGEFVGYANGSPTPNVKAIRMTTPDGGQSSVNPNFVDKYLKKGYSLGWSEKHKGGIVGDGDRDLPETVNKLFNTKADEQMVKAKVGELFVPKENLSKYFVPNMQRVMDITVNSLVASIPDLLKKYADFKNLVPNINIPSLNQSLVNSSTTHNQPTQIIHNHIDKLVFPDVHDAKEIEDSVLNLPRITIQNG